FLRRHADLSPDGLGAIYEIDVNTKTPTLWMNLNSKTHLGSSATLFPHETAANRGLSSPFAPSHDVWAYSRVAKEGLGGLDISDDYKTIYAMDLSNRQLLVIDTASKTVSNRYPITNPGCDGGAGDVRPFAVDYIKGEVYVGVSCSGETRQKDSDVNAHVMKLTGSSFTSVVSTATGFKWESYWTDEVYAYGSSCNNLSYSLRNAYIPLITNIELDNNNNMVIGVTSRNGFRFGEGNYAADESCNKLIKGHESRGFVLNATPSGSQWNLSSNELWNTDNGDEKHHYKDGIYAHWGSGTSQTYIGGMAKTDCSGEEVILTNLMDPLAHETSGTRYMRTSDAQQEAAQSIGDTTIATSTASTRELTRGVGNSWEKSA
ncbi:MAG: Conserved repeat domain protein, partial [uncultured Sulfurovum sp.]